MAILERVFEAVQRPDIATTHSRDCYQSLAEICEADRDDPSEITMQRIDRKQGEAVAYSEAAIIAAAERDIEVR